jgi:cell wall-associated NlpC family hydrolase
MAYHAASVALPRTTGDQVRAGVPVPDLGQIRPGDLIFIPGADGSASSPGHVALYVGDDLAVHAPHQGEVVQLVNITNWHSMISIIRRPVRH